ncbi:uncharacterized protein si:dkey-151j17.4 [Colossoma macropomum]|uniref:uncharacterized protein si:dkey-151j17.4 n=1 Tax=Colossoma macropomum TaxID=42526 RepID=UPI001863C35B|nr:uncharacterized protein si:dkey-151j17.4 [Colossoma macropomum]
MAGLLVTIPTTLAFSRSSTLFEINLKTGQAKGDDTAFHFKLFTGKKVVMNSFRNGKWENEESATDKPFTKRAPFTMFFVIKPEGYEVYVNGSQHYMFKHRIPLEKVSAIDVRGDVTMNAFHVTEKIPYVGAVSGGIRPGMAVYFQGIVPQEAKQFEINLKIGQAPGDDTAFHFSPRIGERVALNSFRNGGWESEESASDKPFTKGAPFNMFFLIKPEGYEVYVNGFRHCMFKHRIPLEKVSAIDIRGHVNINLFGFIKNWSTSSFFKELETTHPEISHPVSKPKMPYVGAISGGIRPGMALYFQGTVPQEAEKFEINLKTGQAPGDDTAFHFSPRIGERVALNSFRNGGWESEESASDKPFTKGAPFNITGALPPSLRSSRPRTPEISHPVSKPKMPYVGAISGGIRPGMALYFQGTVPQEAEKFEINLKTGQAPGDDTAFHFSPRIGERVALNSFRNGGWESEESASDKPFTKGAPFNMFFLIKPEGYEVYVNGFRHCMFKHRILLEKVSAIDIRGNVTMNLFGLITNWSTSSFFKELETTHPEISHPVSKPKMPYVGAVSGGIRPGMALYFQGNVPQEAEKFEINLKTGQAPGDDTAFHFNPRIGERVTLNSFRNGGWESEESASDKPFTKGKPFTMFYVIKPEGYEVYVNGFKHCMFKHRIPLEKVSAIDIRGNVTMNLFGFINNWSTSSFFKEHESTAPSSVSTTPSEISHPVSNPTVPHVGAISGGIRPGMALYFQGTVPQEAEKFEINLKTGQAPGDDTAFHFNPRIGKRVALNSFRNGGWESEESASDKPFTKGKPFTMFYVIKPEGYEVYVNGFKHCMFKHRIPLEKVSAIDIRGNVTMNLFGFINNWSTSSFFKEHESTAPSSVSTTPSEISHPVSNPTVPHVGAISGGIRPGMALYFQGTVPQEAEKFEINLKTGQASGDDTAFHFSPRIGERVTLNSFRSGGWEIEELASDKPFTKGKPFTMFYVIKPEGYEVYVNGFKHCMFKHRIPLEKVSAIDIRGNVTMNLFGLITNWSTSSFFKELETTHPEISHPVSKPKMPYVGAISGGIRPGMALYFQGTVPQEAEKFEINLKTGQAPGDDTAFHFNPRIGERVTLNSFRNGGWEIEESASAKPFTKGKPFTMFYVIKPEGYEVYVNGFKHCMFKHRIPLEKVSAIDIRGNVTMNLFGFINNWSTSSFFKEHESTAPSSVSTTPSEISHPVSNPTVPHVGAISGGIRPGMALYFQGTVPQEAEKFEINLKTGQAPGDDTAFHFNPRIGERVTLNSFRNGGWDIEESASAKPFTKGKPFTMFYVIKPEGYEVYVNGFKHCMFKHRIPLEKVSAIDIRGNVTMNLFGFINNWSTSSFFKEHETTAPSSVSTTPSEISHPVSNPTVPHVGAISGGIRPGMALYFQGTVPQEAEKFEINLKTGQAPGDDTAFHFNPRIGERVTLNSFRSGGWEIEELASAKPFTKGKPFTMFYVIKPEGYEVYVNGFKHCMFKHRIPLEKVSAIDIRGNVTMNLFGFINNWSTSSFFKEHETTAPSSVSTTPSEISHPVSNPTIPHVGAISGAIRPGMALYFQGTVPQEAEKFEINLKTGQAPGDDTAFHFNPRIGERVTLNSFRSGGWEIEELASAKPFTKGKPFTMFYVIKPEGYEVYVNGFKHCMFKHRIPLEKVSAIDIRGNVTMNLFGFINNWSTSSFFKEHETTAPSSVSTTPSEISHPVSNPTIPHVGAISGAIRPGMALYFQGTVPQEAEKFEINLKTGQAPGDDTAFHFNPRVGERVTLNSFRNGGWESEETASDKPFTKGAPFTIIYVIKPEGYEVYVNGFRHCMFKHRIPLEKVSAIDIRGHVTMNLLGFINNWSTSSFFKEHKTTHSEISHPVSKPKIPYVGAISGGIRPGMALYFQGTVPQEAEKFEINLKTGQAPGDDTAFHFNPRIGERVTLNSFRNGGWEIEESASDKPFTKGAPFTIFYVIKPEGYEVYVNGFQHCMFKHRIPLEKVSALVLDGDVTINILGVIEKWSSSSFFTEHQIISDVESSSSSLIQLEVSHAVSNPAIPYVGTIPEGIKPDMAICFQGTVPENASQFSVNLKTGPTKQDDIAFHFKPNIGQKVTLNSFRNGSWESEESASDKPFTKGAAFNMFVVIGAEGYEVYVNGMKHCMFKHRIPVEKVSNLEICGDVSMHILGYIDKWSSSSFFTEQQKMSGFGSSSWSASPIQLEVSHPVSNPAIPYVGTIPEGIKPDMAICFQGTVPEKASQFAVNFKTGPSNQDDIAFHFKPNIGQKVSLNSFRNGSWESEESASDKPFTKGAAFNMFVVIGAEGYEVYVNGMKHCMFKHRIPVEKVSHLEICGDVSMHILGYIDKWSSSSFFTEQQKMSGFGSSSWSPSPIQLEVSHPVSNPAIPYVGTIPEGIKPDMAICFQGTVPEKASQFAVNFKTGPSNQDDIAFHFKPNIGQKVSLNSFRNGSWESEESASDKPFTKGAAFNMFVVIGAEGYEVYVNGMKHCMFKHRIPVEKVSHLEICGDVSMHIFGYMDKWSSSSFFMEQQEISCMESSSCIQLEVSYPVSNPAIPYVGTIPEGIKPNMAVCFQGTVPAQADEFSINFKTGPSDGDDIAFHFNPRIGERVALNSFRNGSWESEESALDRSFSKGAPFNMFVVITAEGYEVNVNSMDLCMFKHRIPLEKVSVLNIFGNVSIDMVGFVMNWNKELLFSQQSMDISF